MKFLTLLLCALAALLTLGLLLVSPVAADGPAPTLYDNRAVSYHGAGWNVVSDPNALNGYFRENHTGGGEWGPYYDFWFKKSVNAPRGWVGIYYYDPGQFPLGCYSKIKVYVDQLPYIGQCLIWQGFLYRIDFYFDSMVYLKVINYSGILTMERLVAYGNVYPTNGIGGR